MAKTPLALNFMQHTNAGDSKHCLMCITLHLPPAMLNQLRSSFLPLIWACRVATFEMSRSSDVQFFLALLLDEVCTFPLFDQVFATEPLAGLARSEECKVGRSQFPL